MLTRIVAFVKMKVMERFFKQCPEIETLKAIESVRAEFVAASKRGDAVECREIHARLMTLYAALNVHNVIMAIEHIDFKKDSENDAA
jgi:hypothetical protein